MIGASCESGELKRSTENTAKGPRNRIGHRLSVYKMLSSFYEARRRSEIVRGGMSLPRHINASDSGAQMSARTMWRYLTR
jgi:hypothetical protein